MRRGADLLLRLGIVLWAVVPHSASADEDRDLDFIPKEPQEASMPLPAAPPPSVLEGSRQRFVSKFHLEEAFTAFAPRTVPVPLPFALFDWENRTSFDAVVRWHLWKQLAVTLSDRLNVLAQDSRFSLRNDFREGYLSWEPAVRSYLEAGRINVRNGVALGFNPTDFFKTRTFVRQTSLDPSVIRENRLGTLMVRGETIWDGGSASIAFAPKLYEPSPIVTSDSSGVDVDPRFDATNAAYRQLCTLNLDLAGLSPQALAYFDSDQNYVPKLGLNLTRQLGAAVIAYAEWAGGWEANLITRAVAYGKATGTLPAIAPTLPPTDSGKAFRNDFAGGASWTIATTMTLNLEYHFHQGAFSRRDWQNWIDIGSAQRNSLLVTSELWYIRGFANAQQEPLPMHQMFVRAAWPRALANALEITAFAFVNLLDASTLAQVAASYDASDEWTFALYGIANIGDGRSERGSFPQAGGVGVQVIRYFSLLS